MQLLQSHGRLATMAETLSSEFELFKSNLIALAANNGDF